MMKLFYTPLSPYARKCRVVMLEKRLEGRVELIHTPPIDNPPELLAVTPLVTVPALVTDDGRQFYDSTVICEYFDSLAPEPPLYPKETAARIDALALATLADGIMNASVACVLESRRPEDKRYGAWVERKENAVKRGIATIAGQLPDSGQFDIAVISVVVALDYVSFRQPHIDWRSQHPQLAGWYAMVSTRPSLSSTLPSL